MLLPLYGEIKIFIINCTRHVITTPCNPSDMKSVVEFSWNEMERRFVDVHSANLRSFTLESRSYTSSQG